MSAGEPGDGGEFDCEVAGVALADMLNELGLRPCPLALLRLRAANWSVGVPLPDGEELWEFDRRNNDENRLVAFVAVRFNNGGADASDEVAFALVPFFWDGLLLLGGWAVVVLGGVVLLEVLSTRGLILLGVRWSMCAGIGVESPAASAEISARLNSWDCLALVGVTGSTASLLVSSSSSSGMESWWWSIDRESGELGADVSSTASSGGVGGGSK